MTGRGPAAREGRASGKMAPVSGRFRGRVQQVLAVLVALTALTACGTAGSGHNGQAGQPMAMGQQHAAEANPDLDPGTSLGGAGQNVQLLGIDANPDAAAVSDVMAYSRSHAMVNQWDFLTGSPAQLHAVWKAYHIYVQIQSGQVDHTPALFVINQRGQEEKVYLTTMAYASVGQSAQILANEVSGLLPGHPRLASERSLSYISGISPKTQITLPAEGSGSVTLGPGKPRLVVFFATWLTETSDLRAELLALNGYAQDARRGGLPAGTPADEAVLEPGTAAVRSYLAGLRQPLQYPGGLEERGRLPDGYGVQDQPWLVLVSSSGKILWSHDGWLTLPALEAAVARPS